MRIFGSDVMVHVPKEKRRKLDKKAIKLTFVGYDEQRKGYRCIDKETLKLTISRDVIFHEKYETQQPNIQPNMDTDDTEEENASNEIATETNEEAEVEETEQSDTDNGVNNQDNSSEHESTFEDAGNEGSLYEPDEEVQPGRSDIVTRSKASKMREFDLAIFALLSAEPLSVKDIESRPDKSQWLDAMKDEMDSHAKNGTWALCELPKDAKTVKSKWVFKAKKDTEGKMVRHKARLVAMGFTQRPGIDYNETFCPVIKYTSLRILFAIAVNKGMRIHQMDAVSAFLQGTLKEDIYMAQPELFHDGTNRVCKLNKAIYGLKQAGNVWNEKLGKTLNEMGLKKCHLDPCIFFNENRDMIIGIYVDDMIILYKHESELQRFKAQLKGKISVKDIGTARSCIGINIQQMDSSIIID